MDGLNRVMLIGNLGQDPVLRFTQNQQAVLSLRIATTESYFDNTSKERRERTEWHAVVVWGKRGEGLHKLLAKGSRVGIEGHLQGRSWEDKQGNKRHAIEIVATNVLLLDGRRNESRPSSELGDQERDHSDEDQGGGDIPF